MLVSLILFHACSHIQGSSCQKLSQFGKEEEVVSGPLLLSASRQPMFLGQAGPVSGPTSGHGHLSDILQWSVTFWWEDGGPDPWGF